MAADVPPGASPTQGSPSQAAPLADVPPPVDPAAAGADALPPPPPPIADTGEVPAADQAAAMQPAPGTFVTTTAADAPVAQVMIDPSKREGPKKEFMAAVKSYEEIVGGNVIRGKMYLESKPQYEAPMGMGGGGFDRPTGMGYQGHMPYPTPMGMGGFDRPPMGYDEQMGGYGYDRPPMGGYGYDRPPGMYGQPRDRPYSPDRGRYPPDYDRPPMDRRERPRSQRDDDYYYDELPKGRSETRVPVKKESDNRAERVIQKIRQDIEAFDKDEAGVEDATNVPGSKPSESMERKPRTGPARALWKATDDYEGEPPAARRSPRQRSSSHRSRDEGDDYDDYDDKRRGRKMRSKSRHDYEDEDRHRRGRSRRDESSSSSSSSSDGRRQRRRRHDSDDYDHGRSSSRRRRGSDDHGDKHAKRSRSRSKRRDEDGGERSASRPRKGKAGDEGLVTRPTDDRNFMQAGMLYRYESQPLMLVKGDMYNKEEAAAAPAPQAGQEFGQKADEGVPQQARFLSPDQYQDFLLGVRAGRRPLGYPVRATPSAVAEELGRYHDFLGSVMPEGAPRDAMAAEVGKYHSFILGTGSGALRAASPDREKKFTEFLVASNKGVARVVKPVPPEEAAQGAAAGIRPPPGYQSFTVQAKPTVVPKGEPPQEYHAFAVQAKAAPPPSPPPHYHEFAVQAKPAPPPEPEPDNMARATSSDNLFAMQTRPQGMPGRMKGERYEHMEDTPQLKTEWWSRTAGAYDGTRPPSRSRSMRGRRGLARSASPRMVSPRRKAYEDENGDAYQVTSLEMEGPMSNQYAQMRVSRRGRDPNKMYSMTRRMSPTAAAYGGPPRRASPEMIGMGGGMQGMSMPGMQMQGMQMPGMQGMQMQGMPMQGMGMQPMAMQPMGMPMSMQAMPMQGMPVQYDPRSGRVPMRMDRRIHQILSQQQPGGRYTVAPMQVAGGMPVQAQDGVMFKYQIQNESRQRQADEGDSKDDGPATRDVLIETSKEVLVEKIVSSQEVQAAEKKVSKATSARVKTRSSAAATHEAGFKRNAEAQAEIEEQMPHVSFTRNSNYDSPPPGYPFPMGQFGGMFPPAAPPPQPAQTVSSTTVHTHQHHHHYHDSQKNYKIAYLLPRSGDLRRDKLAQDRYEDQEPLGAAVGVQCLSLYERFMNWIYPEAKQTEDVSLMTDADELCDDKKRPGKKGKKAGKKGEKDNEVKSEESKKGDKKGAGSESEAEAKGKSSEAVGKEGEEKGKKEGEEEKKKVPPGPPIPVNLPWQGHEYEYEEEIKPDGSRVGKYRYKGLGGAPKLPEEGAAQESIFTSSKEPPVIYETTTTRMESDGQQLWQREIRPIPAEARMEAMMPMKDTKESRESYQRQMRQYPSQRSFPGQQRRSVQTKRKVPRAVERGGAADNFVPDVQIRLDFGDTSDNSGSRGSKTKSEASAAWQPADMVVSYAHKSFDEKNATDDEEDDDDDEMLPSGHVYGGHGSTKKLIRRGRKMRGMPNKELMAYSMVVLVAVVGLALLVTMTGHRSHSRHTFGLDRHLVLNTSKLKGVQAGPGGGTFWHAAPAVCKDARCLTKGSAAVRHLPRDYLRSACSDFYQFVCAHQNATDSPRMVSRRELEDGVLGVIKAQEKYPELMTARHLYKECLNKEAISERGWDPLAELQESTELSGWPFTDPVQQPLVWRAAGRTLRRFNLAALLSLGIEKHPQKHGASIISVGHPELLLPASLGNRSVKWYYGAVMHALAPFRERIVTPVFAVEVSAFESRLANIVRPQPRMAVQRLAERPELAEFLGIALENITRVTKTTEFLVRDVDYVDDLVSGIKETAPHIVLNYLGFRQVVVASPFLPSKLQALSALGRSPALRKEICLAVVAESLPVMSLYAGFNAFKQGLNNFKAANISGATKDAVSSFVKKMSWMDEATKAKVSKKILNSHVKTFHPSWISDKFKVFAQHENVPMVSENEGLRSYAAIRKALFENTLKAEAAHIDERWIGTILDPQCSFDAQGTNIYAPVSFWNVSSPSSDNFLMMHMPDTLPRISQCLMTTLLREGGDSDHEENQYSKPLWTATTKKHFSNVRHCFAKQLSGTASENASTTAILSLVADTAALSPSFKIYKKFVSEKKIDVNSFEKTLNMNVDQFFFVSYASSYCGNSPPAKPSHHSEVTNRDRVNSALKNSPEFHAAFRCASNRAMNPEHKCRLWRTS